MWTVSTKLVPPLFLQGLGEVDSRSAHASSRSLRVRKVVKPCPACKADIADFLGHAQVNRSAGACVTGVLPVARVSFYVLLGPSCACSRGCCVGPASLVEVYAGATGSAGACS